MKTKDEIINAWEALERINSMIKCGCTIEEDDVIDIRCLYYKAREFMKTCEKNEKL